MYSVWTTLWRLRRRSCLSFLSTPRICHAHYRSWPRAIPFPTTNSTPTPTLPYSGRRTITTPTKHNADKTQRRGSNPDSCQRKMASVINFGRFLLLQFTLTVAVGQINPHEAQSPLLTSAAAANVAMDPGVIVRKYSPELFPWEALYKDIHQHPELSRGESRTASLIASK